MKKQQRFKKIRNAFVILTAALVLIYIGIEPYFQKRVGNTTVYELILFAVCLAVLVLVFVYNSKYGKLEERYEDLRLKCEDAGYYFTSREEKDIPSFLGTVEADLRYMGYKTEKDITVSDLPAELSAYKKNEFFYAVSTDRLERSDIIAYVDAVMNDVTVVNLKRKGECVILFVCNEGDGEALKLSKDIYRVSTSRNSRVVFTPAIAELETGRVYFPGNRISRAQKMIVNFVMNCDFPIKEEYIGKEKLSFQLEAEKELI